MSINKILVFALIIISNTIMAQQSINNYKYVVVPKRFDFLKSEDQYQLNSLTKFLFEKENFETLFDSDSRPQELNDNPCLSLISRVRSNSGMFSTKLYIELVNCKNEIIVTSEEGKSKQKEYKKAYQEALRKAFESIASLDYKYNSIKASSIAKEEEVVIEDKPVIIEKEPVPPIKIESKEKPVEVIQEVVPVEVVENETPQIENTAEQNAGASNLLYAQKNALGYQLVDSTPKVVYILLKSNREGVYFLKNKKGILYKDGEKWIIEYYKETTLIKEEVQIKF